jgi:hypothetical protein
MIKLMTFKTVGLRDETANPTCEKTGVTWLITTLYMRSSRA